MASLLRSLSRRGKKGSGNSSGTKSKKAESGDDIKCLQWNILADGLSEDGFIILLMGLGDRVPVNRGDAGAIFTWDGAEDYGMKISEETFAPLPEYIADSAMFGSTVVPKVRAALLAIFGKDAYADKNTYEDDRKVRAGPCWAR